MRTFRFRPVGKLLPKMAKTEAEIAARSKQADAIIADLKEKINKIKSMGPLPPNIQETILKQENAQLRK